MKSSVIASPCEKGIILADAGFYEVIFENGHPVFFSAFFTADRVVWKLNSNRISD